MCVWVGVGGGGGGGCVGCGGAGHGGVFVFSSLASRMGELTDVGGKPLQ